MSDKPKYYEIFELYFKHTDKPSLKDFVEEHKHMLVVYHEEKEDLKQLWAGRFGKAYNIFYQDTPKDQKPKKCNKAPDWGSVALEIISAQAHQAGTNAGTSENNKSSDESKTSTTTNSTSSLPPITKEFIDTFREVYSSMVDEEKWELSTGKVIEDVLFSFGLTCQYEKSCHSFILDLGDEDLCKRFTMEEIHEICDKEAHPLPPVSQQLLKYLNNYMKLTTVEELETCTRKRWYDFNNEFELNWAQFSIQCAIRLFQAKFFPLTDQTEADIIRRVWTFVDTVFDDINVDVRTDEMESVASSERRNAQRVLNERKKHGHKSDILFKVAKGEIGCSEVGKKDCGDAGTKEMKELGLKVPKMMKDQLWHLIRSYPEKSRRLTIIGYVMMGLKLRVVVMDNPSTYICRLNRTPAQFFPSTIENFASQLCSLLGLVSQVKELARQTLNVLDEVSPLQSTSYTLSVNHPAHILPCPQSPKISPKKTRLTLEQ